MRVMVLGSRGMAGHVVTQYLRNNGYTVDTAARESADYAIDLDNVRGIENFIKHIINAVPEYDYVINCVGLLVKDSIARPDRAVLINSLFPHQLEEAFKNTNTRIIHLSTDCVFDGKLGRYTAFDRPNEVNYYGMSKALGELRNDKDATFRMSIIGPELKENGTGLFHWFCNTEEPVNGWDNAYWNGITTLQLAKCIDIYMRNPCFSGIYHVVNSSNRISKYELLRKINQIFDLKKVVNLSTGPKEVDKTLIDTQNLIDFGIPDYDTMLAEMRDFKQ